MKDIDLYFIIFKKIVLCYIAKVLDLVAIFSLFLLCNHYTFFIFFDFIFERLFLFKF